MTEKSKNYPIGKIELSFCFIVWILNCLGSIRIAIRTSKNLTPWISHFLSDTEFFEDHKYDKADLEWFLHKKVILRLIFCFSIHCIVFRISHFFYHKFQRLTQCALILFWSAITVYLTR